MSNAISGYFVHGKTVEMVTNCHKCGQRVVSDCPVCGRLHPLTQTDYCPATGINVVNFDSERARLYSELSQFTQRNDIRVIGRRRIVVFQVNFAFWSLGTLVSIFLSFQREDAIFLAAFLVSFFLGMSCHMLSSIHFENKILDLWYESHKEHLLVDFSGSIPEITYQNLDKEIITHLSSPAMS